jgi:hypothetical protein
MSDVDDSLEFLESSGETAAVYAGEQCEWRKSSLNRCIKHAQHTFLGSKVCGKHHQQLLDCLGDQQATKPPEPQLPSAGCGGEE